MTKQPRSRLPHGERTVHRTCEKVVVILCVIIASSMVLLSYDLSEISAHPKSVEIPVVDDNPVGQGLNWTNDTRLTYEPHHSILSDLAVEGENLHLVWTDNRYRNHYAYAVPPYNTVKTVTYSIYTTDFAGNFNTTSNYSFQVTAQDTIPPEIEHEPIRNRTTGRETLIEAIVRDNSQVESVRLDFVDVSGRRFNVSMNLLQDDPRYYFTYRATIPPQAEEGSVEYFIWAGDAEGNANRTAEHSFSVSSEDCNPPAINHDPPRTELPGYEVYIEVEAFDDSDVDAVGLEYRDVKGDLSDVDMFQRDNNTYSFGIPPQPFVGYVNYTIWARDINGNENRSSTYSMQIVSEDKEPPTIVHTPIKDAVIGYWVPVHAFVLDNFGLYHNVRLDIDGTTIMLGLLATDGVDRLYYKRSTDGGRTWDDGLGNLGVDRPLTYRGHIHWPRIAVEGDNIHVIYENTYPQHGTYHLVSRDNGASWSSPTLVANSAQGGDIAVHGDSVYVAWVNYDVPHLSSRVHLSFSIDGGRAWSYEAKLNQTMVPAGRARIALDGEYLHVVTGEYGSRYLRYMRGKWTGNGFFWDDGEGREGEAKIVANNSAPYPPEDYSVSAIEGKIQLVYLKEIPHYTRKLWCDGFVYDFYTPYYQLLHVGSLNAGSDWLAPTILVDHTDVPWDHHTCDPLYPRPQGHRIWDTDVVFDGSTTHVVWSDTRDDNSTLEVYYKTGDAEGGNWSNDTRLTFNESFDSVSVAIAVWDHNVHLTWSDGRDRWWGTPKLGCYMKEIYYKRFPKLPSVRPPASISASLEGAVYKDVNITFDKSPDDIVETKMVMRYELYYSTEYSRSGDGYQLLAFVDANESDGYYYVHKNAGNGNPNNYFYRVVAIDSNNGDAPCSVQAAKYTRWLTSGMHLISIPLELGENRIDEVFRTLDFQSIWHHDASNQIWRSCHRSKPYCYFPAIDRGMAFWVDVGQDSYLTVTGVVPLTTWVRLERGWNLVGYPSFKNRSVITAFAGIGFGRLEAYDGSSPPYYLQLLTESGQMRRGEGYWVYSNAPQYWVLRN